nr:MAG TPA: hypothetical protein [Caudoviricetes sp.]DAP79037.1 MAG TPA: hypothetical protein [Caudoviricetes sp.]
MRLRACVTVLLKMLPKQRLQMRRLIQKAFRQ